MPIVNGLPTHRLPNGDTVTINNHVYFAPPWNERDGTPYTVARIIEFLPPSAAKRSHLSTRKETKEPHVRLALFYRPTEISGRVASDHRLLMAAIHSEVHPISWLRGKCYVRHREKIEYMNEWKKLPDHFHYTKFFDPYVKKEYDMIRTSTVNNIPERIKRVLVRRYEFLVTEKEMVSDLTDGFRTCHTCEEWAAPQKSVRCESCKFHYHMDCVSPPLQAKPAKGYSWMCSPCNRAFLLKEPPPVVNTMSGRPKGSKNKDLNLNRVDYDKPDATFRGWNFRYFGQFTVAEDSIDPDDPIFPRNVTRIGNRYQAVVPTWEEQQAIELERAQEPITADLPVRGHDQGGSGRAPTIIWKSKPDPNLAEFITSIRQLKLPVPVFSVEAYDKSLMIYLVRGGKAALKTVADAKFADYYRPLKHFTGEDLENFEAQVAKFGSLEAHSTAKLLGKNVWEVVRFYYVWKNELLGQQHAAERAAKEHQTGAVRAVKAIKAKVSTKHQLATTALPTGASVVMGHFQRESTSESDAEGSIWEADEMPRDAKPSCAICGNKKVESWYKAPRSQSGPYLCNWCGLSFRKYGVAIPYKGTLDDTNKKADKREGTPLDGPTLKKLKIAAAVAAISKPSTPPPPPPLPPKVVPCCLCLKLEPKIIARCKNCTFAIHPGCYGIPTTDVTADWLCEPCNNEKNLDASLDISCVLCPRKLPRLVRPIKIRPKVMPDFDFLDALKTTEGYKWAHILCSIFVPDITYADASRLKVAEGIMSINQQGRFRGICTICHKTGDGAVIECGDCDKTFHPACGWLSGFRFGFELTPPPSKTTKKEPSLTTVIKDGSAMVMNARCWCNEHLPQPPRMVLGLQDYVSEWNQTALRKYAISYRASPSSAESFGLLRKAQRIEAYLTKAKEDKTLNTAKDGTRLTSLKADTRVNSTKEDTSLITAKKDTRFAPVKDIRPAPVKDTGPDPNYAASQSISV